MFIWRNTLICIFALACFIGCSNSGDFDEKATHENSSLEENVNKNSELICERVRPTGSNFYIKQCRTREELEKEREKSRRALDHSGPSSTSSSGT